MGSKRNKSKSPKKAQEPSGSKAAVPRSSKSQRDEASSAAAARLLSAQEELHAQKSECESGGGGGDGGGDDDNTDYSRGVVENFASRLSSPEIVAVDRSKLDFAKLKAERPFQVENEADLCQTLVDIC